MKSHSLVLHVELVAGDDGPDPSNENGDENELDYAHDDPLASVSFTDDTGEAGTQTGPDDVHDEAQKCHVRFELDHLVRFAKHAHFKYILVLKVINIY